ncbi:MAG: FecR family protein, partial [Planctomycetales bacterium]
FNSGARVVLQGPAAIIVQSDMAAELQYGRLTARVPPPAQGFTVYAAAVQVIDLGTEFGLRLRASGVLDVHVFNGVVEVVSPASLEAEPLRMEYNEAARFNPEGELDQRLTCNPEAFAFPRKPRSDVDPEPILALKTPTDVETALRSKLLSAKPVVFDATPLEDAARFLGDLHDVALHLDAESMRKEGLRPQAPVTLKHSRATLREILEALAEPHEMSVLIFESRIFVTTLKRARELQRQTQGVAAEDSPDAG